MQALARRVEHGGALTFAGVAPAAHPFFAALLQSCRSRPIVLVAENLKAQESFHQDLETWLRLAGRTEDGAASSAPPSNLWFYPAWETLPQDGKLPHADVISERLQTLIALSAWTGQPAAAPPLVVASVASLMQKTYAPGSLQKRARQLKRGDKIAPLDLVEFLEAQGYEPEAQVSQKGELSLRGGIVDVFPPTSPWPVRLEFFGDELESLRHFDPQTQISREAIAEITLSPAGEIGILRNGTPKPADVNSGDSPAIGGEVELALLTAHLPRETVFVLCDPAALAAHAESYWQQIVPGDPFHVPWPEFLAELKRGGFTSIELDDDDLPSPVEILAGEGAVTAQSGSQPGGPVAAEPHDSELGHPYEGMRRVQADGLVTVNETRVGAGEGAVRQAPPLFASLDAFRPLAERAPEPAIAEAQRREFFQQMHRWLRQGQALHVICNHPGERQRFEELWQETGPEPAAEAGPGGQLCLHLGSVARGFICEAAKLVVVTDSEIFGRYKVQRPRRLKSPHALAARSALDIDFTDLEEGDLVVHLQHGIGRYLGLKRLPAAVGRRPPTLAEPLPETECLVIEYAASDPANEPPKLYVPVSESHLVSKYVGAGKAHPPLNTLGGARWAKAKEQTEKAVRDVAAELLRIQAVRATQPGHACRPDTPWQREFESAFIYEETPDQMTAITETKADQERAKPMDRLICGDVGFGKTEVAIRAAFKSVMDGQQVAVLVPTTVLAQQHFNNFRERMADYPIRVELLSRFRTKREQTKVVQDLAAGAVDIVIGTHRIVQDDIAFKDLGLVVIDEEQRFGVLHKEKFKRLRTMVDVLTLSATPIPRTLYQALTGARDMSTIQTPPHDRLPVETIATQYDERLIRDAIQRELNRGGQIFFLHNRVTTIETMRAKLQTLVPQARIVVGHGQMHADDLEEVMTQFVNGGADILLSTTIIESGLDIPNANTIIIDRADRFGLSELYQLRGRVGRYKHQAYAYLLLPRHARLLTDVRKRISAMKQYATLGSGFKIAMRDLEIRGAGNLLGAEQSGHITAVGFELYCQLLKQSVSALKGEKVKPRVEVRVALDFLPLDTALPDPGAGAESLKFRTCAALPDHYVSEPHHRIEIYRKLAQATEKPLLEALQAELRDRFGPLPAPVELLLGVAELKLIAGEKKVTSIEVEDAKLKLVRAGDFITLGGKFPRLTKQEPKARLKEIKRLLLAI